jgi:hypothetical protein
LVGSCRFVGRDCAGELTFFISQHDLIAAYCVMAFDNDLSIFNNHVETFRRELQLPIP